VLPASAAETAAAPPAFRNPRLLTMFFSCSGKAGT